MEYLELIDTCMYAGFPKKQLAAFSWLINLYETTENQVRVFDLLWHYKWITEGIVHFSEISLEKINHLTIDMETKFKEYNYSLRPYYKIKTLQAISMGDLEAASENFVLWQGTKADFMNDCTACETTEIVSYYHFIGAYKKAIKVAAPILKGKQSCAEVPHITYGHTALAYFKLNQLDKAQDSFDRGYPMVKQRATFISTVAQFIEYLVISKQHQKAIEVYQENLDTVEALETDNEKLHFYTSSSKIDFPDADEVYQKAVYYATKFDERNQNNYYKNLLIIK